jgi:hypothetical protein
MDPFKIKQFLFYFNSMAKAAQAAIAFDDPMAGDNQGQRVFAIGISHCTKGLWMADSPGNLLIGSCLTVWDLCQF